MEPKKVARRAQRSHSPTLSHNSLTWFKRDRTLSGLVWKEHTPSEYELPSQWK